MTRPIYIWFNTEDMQVDFRVSYVKPPSYPARSNRGWSTSDYPGDDLSNLKKFVANSVNAEHYTISRYQRVVIWDPDVLEDERVRALITLKAMGALEKEP